MSAYHFGFIHQKRMKFLELRVLAQDFLRHVKLPRETVWVPNITSVV